MEELETREQSLADPSGSGNGTPVAPISAGPPSPPSHVGPAQAGPAPAPAPGPVPPPCPTCGTAGATMPPRYVYTLGRIEPRFPRASVEKEFAQATGRAETVNLTDRQALQRVLQQNRYLVRQMCWVMKVAGLETYIVAPRDPSDSQLLVESLRQNSRPGDLDLVVGRLGGIAPPELCNGLQVPLVVFDQMYSFDRDSLIGSIPLAEGVEEQRFREAAAETFDRLMMMTDNAGATDEHRALNYLLVRYQRIYTAIAEAHGRNLSLTAVDTRPSPLSGAQKILRVIFSFTHRTTDVVEKHSVDVNLDDEWPYLVTRLAPYFDR